MADDVEPVVLDSVDRREPLVAERVAAELGQAPRGPVVVEGGVVLEQDAPTKKASSTLEPAQVEA